jgi:hypothetical protein
MDNIDDDDNTMKLEMSFEVDTKYHLPPIVSDLAESLADQGSKEDNQDIK